MSENSLNLGVSILIDLCHAPIIKDMKIRGDVIEFLNEECGPRADTFFEWVTDPSKHWYSSEEIVKTPRKDAKKVKDDVISIMFRTEDDAMRFLLTFGQSGTNTNWR